MKQMTRTEIMPQAKTKNMTSEPKKKRHISVKKEEISLYLWSQGRGEMPEKVTFCCCCFW